MVPWSRASASVMISVSSDAGGVGLDLVLGELEFLHLGQALHKGAGKLKGLPLRLLGGDAAGVHLAVVVPHDVGTVRLDDLYLGKAA